jgi:hypothetical protein
MSDVFGLFSDAIHSIGGAIGFTVPQEIDGERGAPFDGKSRPNVAPEEGAGGEAVQKDDRLAAVAVALDVQGPRTNGYAQKVGVAHTLKIGQKGEGGGVTLAIRHLKLRAMSEETYDEERARNLERMLRALADHIADIDRRGELLAQAGELLKLLGDIRSELFHYEVRVTYDTPEIAEHRRLVADAKNEDSAAIKPTNWTPEEDDEPTW